MKKFLADYGLNWVGNDSKERPSSNLRKSPLQEHKGKFNAAAINAELGHKAPNYRNNIPKEIDTEVLTRRIEELNFIAEKQRVVKNANGMHEFKKVDPL